MSAGVSTRLAAAAAAAASASGEARRRMIHSNSHSHSRILPRRQLEQEREGVGNHELRRVSSSSSSPQKNNKIGRLILVRHGQSEWNEGGNFPARFTGWADVALTELGREQARTAGRILRANAHLFSTSNDNNIITSIDCAYTSRLTRSKETLDLLLNELGRLDHDHEDTTTTTTKVVDDHHHHHPYDHNRSAQTHAAAHAVPTIPVISSWRLNERHYGALVGQSKQEAEERYSKHLLDKWRHSWDVRPPPMDEYTLHAWRNTFEHCRIETIARIPSKKATTTSNPTINGQQPNQTDTGAGASFVRYRERGYWNGSPAVMPATEAFADVVKRLVPLWTYSLAPRLAKGETLLLSGHANSVKALLHVLEPKVVTQESFRLMKIPNTTPFIYSFEKANVKSHNYHDDDSEVMDDNVILGGLKIVPPHAPLLAGTDERDRIHYDYKKALDKDGRLRDALKCVWLGNPLAHQGQDLDCHVLPAVSAAEAAAIAAAQAEKTQDLDCHVLPAISKIEAAAMAVAEAPKAQQQFAVAATSNHDAGSSSSSSSRSTHINGSHPVDDGGDDKLYRRRQAAF